MSDKYTLNTDDLKRVVINFALYNVPLFLLTLLIAISQDIGIKEALVTASVTFMTALVDIMRKFTGGNK